MREGINAWLSIILKLGAIVIIGLGAFWLVISIWANATENNSQMPDLPNDKRAEYLLIIHNTGEVLISPGYEVSKSINNPDDKVYTLNGFYRLYDDKWKWSEGSISLDEYYFGDIIIKKRSAENGP